MDEIEEKSSVVVGVCVCGELLKVPGKRLPLRTRTNHTAVGISFNLEFATLKSCGLLDFFYSAHTASQPSSPQQLILLQALLYCVNFCEQAPIYGDLLLYLVDCANDRGVISAIKDTRNHWI